MGEASNQLAGAQSKSRTSGKIQVHWDGQFLLSALGVRVQEREQSCGASLAGGQGRHLQPQL